MRERNHQIYEKAYDKIWRREIESKKDKNSTTKDEDFDRKSNTIQI